MMMFILKSNPEVFRKYTRGAKLLISTIVFISLKLLSHYDLFVFKKNQRKSTTNKRQTL